MANQRNKKGNANNKNNKDKKKKEQESQKRGGMMDWGQGEEDQGGSR